MRTARQATPRRAEALVLLAALVSAACRPDLEGSDSLVESTRILAVKAEPPETKPGTDATYTALLAMPHGTWSAPPILWRFCTAPKSPTENNVVSTACLDLESLVAAGTGPSVTVPTPANACSLFGPDTPPGGFRPPDPDITGGYYQPLRADLPGLDPTFHLARIRCNLAGAPADIVTQYASAYVANHNPHLAPLVATIGGAAVSLTAIALGARVDLAIGWSPADNETYAYFDRASQSLTTKRELMRVSWYASGGELDMESTGRSAEDSQTTTNNAWTAPAAPSDVRLWVVLRDDRGGTDFAAYDLSVGP